MGTGSKAVSVDVEHTEVMRKAGFERIIAILNEAEMGTAKISAVTA